MRAQILIRGGRVVDGTGAPAFQADVRVRDGLIAEVAPGLEPQLRERVIDAAGCVVAPGFIESHNHWDAGIWWSPTLDPLPGYGVTTSLNGACAFSAAPLHDDPRARRDIIEIFNFFEDIPEQAMVRHVPWTWRTWSEYQATLEARVKLPVNYAGYCGHIALRLAAMGLDAWDRAASEAEIGRMCELLDDALAAGALGLSSNTLDQDRRGRPVPPRLACEREWRGLFAVLARHPGATFQLMTDNFVRMDGPQDAARIGAMAAAHGVRMQWMGVPTLEFQAKIRAAGEALHERFKAEGREFYTNFHHVSPTSMINFVRSLVFSREGNPVWHELIEAEGEAAKLALLSDSDWRARARASWDHQYPHSFLNQPDALTLRESETGHGPVGVTLADYMAAAAIAHPSDALAEWLLANGVQSLVLKRSYPRDQALVVKLAHDRHALGNLSDSGAHGKLFCGAGDNVLLLTRFVRDEGLLSLEEAVNILTWRAADFFGLHDRDRIAPGLRADLVVFDLAEIERRPEVKTWDVPDGEGGRTWRYTRAPAPMRLTLVNGVPTFDHGEFTGAFPGQFIRPAPQDRPLAQAAE
jgi:N-acyl-D-aspartate/D-glutamate deacylase